MKKLLITAATALSLLLPSISTADIIYYKNGKVRHDVKSQEITMKLCSVCDDVLKLNRDRILGIQGYDNGKLDISFKDDTGLNWDLGHSTTGDCVKIVIKDKEGKEETVRGEDIEKYLFTNDIVPDTDIIAKYDFINVASKYFKDLGLTPGESFSFYRDDVKERYILVSIDRLRLAKNYEYMNIDSSFDKEEMKSLEEKLNSEGKDTYLAVVASAGCSLTPFFVNYKNGTFVEVVFHEWWHENKTDLELDLNEASATTIGMVLQEDFLSKHPEYKTGSFWYENTKTIENYSRYSKTVVEYYNKLLDLYKSDKPDEEKLKIKEQILDEMQKKTGSKMNNAKISFAIAYCRYFELVKNVVKSYDDLKEAAQALKDIPPNDTEKGVEYLEDLLTKNKSEKTEPDNVYKIENTY